MPRGQLLGGEGAGSADTPGVVPSLLGRRARGLSGPVTGPAAGNTTVTADPRGGGQAPAGPGRGTGPGRSGSTTFGGLVQSTPDQLGEPRAAYGGGWADGKLTLRERFIQVMLGTSRQGTQESHSGVPNPQHDGPPLPEYLMDNRTESWQIGTDLTTQEDNPGPFAVTATEAQQAGPPQLSRIAVNGVRTMPLGTQDGVPWTTKIWGGTPGLTRTYGVRGTTALTGPPPAQFALPGDGSGARTGTLLSPRPAGDGPQMIMGGPPHGLHSPTAPSRKWTMARQASIPQQQPPRVDRPNNSKIAGQSYNQTVVPEGNVPEGKTGSGRMPRTPPQVQAGTTQQRLRRT
jgi:hypothetical protein